MLLRDKIYQALRHEILTCGFPPGQELREQTLAERYGVSRTPIRDSLLRLEQEDLVTVLPRQGYLVRPLSISDVEDMLNLRSIIEPACAAAAAQADETSLQVLDSFRSLVDQDLNKTGYINYNESIGRSLTCRVTSASLRSPPTSSSNSSGSRGYWQFPSPVNLSVAITASTKR
jgi:GntR family transcriptional regulator, rspAB operon transcriptional repressor